MVFYCNNKKDYCDNPLDCDNCDVWVLGKGGKFVPSHADRIRAMSDEELAEWMAECNAFGEYAEASQWLPWLKQPAKEEK